MAARWTVQLLTCLRSSCRLFLLSNHNHFYIHVQNHWHGKKTHYQIILHVSGSHSVTQRLLFLVDVWECIFTEKKRGFVSLQPLYLYSVSGHALLIYCLVQYHSAYLGWLLLVCQSTILGCSVVFYTCSIVRRAFIHIACHGSSLTLRQCILPPTSLCRILLHKRQT